VPLAGGGQLTLGDRCLVMGILNVTPDSFDGRSARDHGAAVEEGLRMEAEGADLIDVGGESTRPGAVPVPASEERARVMPVIRALARQLRIPLSIDTYKADVAREAVGVGARIVNDVSALRHDPSLAAVAAESGASLILTHSRGRSADMYAMATYGDLVAEIAAELHASIEQGMVQGVRRNQVILDPGIGFAKRASDSYGLLARLHELAAAMDRPLLVGPSRKSFMSAALEGRPPAERDWGTATAVAASVLAGAHIVRVHAVTAMRQVVRVAEEIRAASVESVGMNKDRSE